MPAPDDALQRAQAMAASLAALLDRVAGAREVLPHLAALESSLRLHGLACLDHAKLPVLAKICSQLASLPLPDDDAPLLTLQNLLLARLRPREEPMPPQRPSMQSSMSEDKVLVVEMTHSAFMEATKDQRDR